MSKEEAFEKLERLVLDGNKIITYKSLSRAMNVNVDKAKEYLREFLEAYETKYKLNSYHTIIGLHLDDVMQECLKCVIVPRVDLDSVKSGFTSISSFHVYAIYKGGTLERTTLYTTDYQNPDRVGPRKPPVIIHPHVEIKSTRPGGRPIKLNDVPGAKNVTPANTCIVDNRQPTTVKKSSNILNLFQKKDTAKSSAPVTVSASVTSGTVSPTSHNTGQDLMKPSASSSNFNADTKKQAIPKKGKAASKSSPGTSGDVKNMFSRQAEKNASKPIVNVKKEKEEEPAIIPSTSHSTRNDRMKPSTSKRGRKNFKLSDSSDSEAEKPKKKKHRRIVAIEDSGSSSENEEADDKAHCNLFNEEPVTIKTEIPDSDDDEPIPPTPVLSGKKKTLKMVTKTFQDEDGFLVTKQSKEYVTDSEESGSEAVAAVNPKPKVNSQLLTNRKQASLTSFFKQK